MNPHQLTTTLETKHCPNSTDAGGTPTTHHIQDGACTTCDRTPRTLAHQHGLNYEPPRPHPGGVAASSRARARVGFPGSTEVG